MIVALAGRRIDREESKSIRFPLSMKDVVRGRILDCLRKEGAVLLISSAACGADLLAQDAARELHIQQHVILPFGRGRFRSTSVTDCPGSWGRLFDKICDEVQSEGNLITLENSEIEDVAYSAVTVEILNRAQKIGGKEIIAAVVWDGSSKGESDETASFMNEALDRKIKVVEIQTLR